MSAAAPAAAAPAIQITATNSTWVLFTGSHEARHQQDLVHFHLCLRAAGWNDQSILHFTEPAANSGRTEYGHLGTGISVHDTTTFSAILNQLPQKDIVVVVFSGHGAADGVVFDAERGRLKGATVINLLKSRPGIKSAIVINGCCFAGGMNFLDAKTNVEMCLMGATSLNYSFSFDFNPNVSYPRFQANLFLFSFAQWIVNKQDVDGDNVLSLLDAYKWAASLTTQRLVAWKAARHRFLIDQLDLENRKLEQSKNRLRQLEIEQKNLEDSIANFRNQGKLDTDIYMAKKIAKLEAKKNEIIKSRLELQAVDRSYQKLGTELFGHQESWILNANFARQIRF